MSAPRGRGCEVSFFDLPACPLLVAGPAGLLMRLIRQAVGPAALKQFGGWGRSSITKTERPRSANLLQMSRGLMCKLRLRGRDYGGPGPAASRGIDPSLQPVPAVAASPLRQNWQSFVTPLVSSSQVPKRRQDPYPKPTHPRERRG